MSDWAIWGALVVGFLAVAGALGLLVVRALQGWRAFKRARRHLARGLEQLGAKGERAAEALAGAGDSAELERSLARLRVSLARLAVLREAADEAQDSAGRLGAVLPRK